MASDVVIENNGTYLVKNSATLPFLLTEALIP